MTRTRFFLAVLAAVVAMLPPLAEAQTGPVRSAVQGTVKGTATVGQGVVQGTGQAGRGVAQGSASVARGAGQATVGVGEGRWHGRQKDRQRRLVHPHPRLRLLNSA